MLLNTYLGKGTGGRMSEKSNWKKKLNGHGSERKEQSAPQLQVGRSVQ